MGTDRSEEQRLIVGTARGASSAGRYIFFRVPPCASAPLAIHLAGRALPP